MPAPTCPPDDQLSSLLSGHLDPTSAEALEQHVETCDRCQETVRSFSIGDESLLQPLKEVSVAAVELEPGCERAMARIRAFAGDGTTGDETGETVGYLQAELPKQPLEPELKTIREYQLLEKLGEGGMGAVYKAVHARLDKTVALKLLTRDRTRDQAAVARFQREMKAVGKLEHPHIVRAMDAGEVEGMHYLVMEYVPGMDLQKLVRRLGKLPIADACELIRQAALGLAEAYEHGMVHRDIKPSNLILSQPRRKQEQATVKVLDLGLALLAGETAFADDDLTGTAQMMGTVDYMAPEQCRSSHDVDIRADIYSLGATLYRLLSGSSPLGSDRDNSILSKLVALATKPAPPLAELRPDVPPALAKLVHTMLAKEPAERFATPEEVADALSPFCSGADLAALLKQAEALPESAEPAAGKDTLANRQSQLSDTATTAKQTTLPARGRRRFSPLTLRLLVGAGGLLLLGIVLYLVTNNGTVKFEITDPEIKVRFVGDTAFIENADKKELRISAGKHKLHVERGEFKFDTSDIELTRGGEVTLKVEWLPGELRVVDGAGNKLGSDTRPIEEVTTAVAASRAAADAPNYALALDDQIHAKVPGLDVDRSRPFTIEAWAEPSKASRAGLVNLSLGTGLRMGAEGNWVFGLTPNVSAKSESAAVLDRWTHVAGVRTEKELLLFVDGKVAARASVGEEQALDPVRCYIGNVNQRAFAGRIDQVRIAQGARYAKEFTPQRRLEAEEQTLALYHFDEGRGNEFKDSSGNGRHGVLQDETYRRLADAVADAKWVPLDGAATEPSSKSPLRYALDFSGSAEGGTAHVALPKMLNPSKPCTIEIYLTPRRVSSSMERTLFNAQGRLMLRCWSTNTLDWSQDLSPDPSKSRHVIATDQMRAGKRTHLAAVSTGTQLRLYLDGYSMGKVDGISLPDIVAKCSFGGAPASSYPRDPFDGVIDEVRISTTARYAKDFTPPSRMESDDDTLAYYDFHEGQGDLLHDRSGNGHHGKIVGAKWVRLDGADFEPSSKSLPDIARAPFDAERARQHQQAWADHLGVPVEMTDELGITFRLIPPGEFQMGASAEDIEAAKKEASEFWVKNGFISSQGPRRRVTITRPFYLATREVTSGPVKKYIQATKDSWERIDRNIQNPEDYEPATVTWKISERFLAWVSGQEKAQYRFPTEAEWEFACRGGATTRYWDGDGPPGGRKAEAERKDFIGIDQAENPFGLIGMKGGHWDWCQDYSNQKAYQYLPATDPVWLKEAEWGHVMRGGSFAKDETAELPAAWRYNDAPEKYSTLYGLRPVREIPLPSAAPPREASSAPPLTIPEPPPLEEWLKGRKVRTVVQDGSGEFKTIQAALDALKPGEVVKVLDKGPYRESLRMTDPPADIGLVSECQTVLEIADWKEFKNENSRFEYRHGHQILNARGFWLSGFEIIGTAGSETNPHVGLHFKAASDVTVEECGFHFQVADPSRKANVIAVEFSGFGPDPTRPIVVRQCAIGGRLSAQGWPKMVAAPVLFLRNFVQPGPNDTGILIGGQIRQVFVRNNVIKTEPVNTGIVITAKPEFVAPEILEIANNTVLGAGFNQFNTAAPASGVTIRENVLPSAFLAAHGAEEKLDALRDWQIAGNWYRIRPESNPDHKKLIFRRPDDPQITPRFLSEDPKDADFARLAAMPDGRKAGALPPGPAPKEGDWFMRLRERWGDKVE